ncbi:MAG: oxygenase MpaB family protein [Ilumatobacteraceae bacterium]
MAPGANIRDEVRVWLADQVRGRVVGPDAFERHAEIHLAGADRWFDDGSVIQRVHADSSMFVGGLRALLLQTLHPLAMAGVADHSDYEHDPWGRLQRTALFLAATTFGPVDVAEEAVARVRAVHAHVVGHTADGRTYEANDPHLLRWVHVAEVDSFLAAYRAYGAAALSDDDADMYVAQMAVIARALGVPAPPESVTGLRDQLHSYRRELTGSPQARQAARYLLWRAPLPVAARAPYGLLAASAVALLPRSARRPLGLPWFPVTEAIAVRPAGDAITRGLRWALA